MFLRADANLQTLLDYSYKPHRRAGRGGHGKGGNRTGRSADDVYLPVPPGTMVRDAESGELTGELITDGDVLLVARGGRGGRGNARFATPTHRAPREWQPGEEGEERTIQLVLKLIADVGLVGEPNAGKSTLLSVLSAARPKIAEYPFTTLEPQLGVVSLSGGRSYVLADIPGLVEGAHRGKGLGDRFLQHIERTRVLVQLVPVDADDLQEQYDRVRRELVEYDSSLTEKPYVVVLTKTDLIQSEDDLPPISAPGADAIVSISAAANRGLDGLSEAIWRVLARTSEERDRTTVPLP